MHALVHEEALARGAALPGAEERGGQARAAAAATSASSRTTKGPLPPISRRSALPAARSATRCPVSIEPMNATACVPGLAAISSPTTGPGPVTRLTTPGRDPGVRDALGQRDGTYGGRRSSRPDDRVAGRERRSDDLGGHRVGPVPRRDDADDSARHAIDEDALRRVDRRRQRALEPRRLGRGLPEVADELVDLVVRLRDERLPLVERERARKGFAPTLDLSWRPARVPPRARRPTARPSRRRLVRRVDRAPRVLPRSLGDRADTFAARRALGVEPGAGLALDPGAADQHRDVDPILSRVP